MLEDYLNIEKNNEKNSNLSAIKEIGGIKLAKSNGSFYTMTIIGQIEGHMILPPQNKATKYEHIIPQIVYIEESKEIKGLLLILNTMGGDVEAGLAIAELISTMKKPTVSIVLGGGHSIGVPLAVSTDFSFIVPTATMTIHPIRMDGLIIGVPQTYEYFNKMQERIISFIISHSKIKKSSLRRLMFTTSEIANDVGTVLVGREAVKYGIIDKIGGLKHAITKLKSLS